MIRRRNGKELLIALFIGAVVGGVLGEVFKRYIPLIGKGATVGFKPITINLFVFNLTLGLSFKITIAVILGMLVAFILISRR